MDELQDLNSDAERKISNESEITLEFQHKYLTLIVHLERLNKELNQYLVHVLQYANEVRLIHSFKSATFIPISAIPVILKRIRLPQIMPQ